VLVFTLPIAILFFSTARVDQGRGGQRVDRTALAGFEQRAGRRHSLKHIAVSLALEYSLEPEPGGARQFSKTMVI
jgi:hypothetical protein